MLVAGLPIELLDKLLDNIKKPSDLLSLALSSKSFQNLQHLIEHRHLTKRVKSVRIIPGVTEDEKLDDILVIPRRTLPHTRGARFEDFADLDPETALGCVRIILDVMKIMTSLQAFDWNASMNLREGQEPFHLLPYIFDSVSQSCPMLQSLYLLRNRKMGIEKRIVSPSRAPVVPKTLTHFYIPTDVLYWNIYRPTSLVKLSRQNMRVAAVRDLPQYISLFGVLSRLKTFDVPRMVLNEVLDVLGSEDLSRLTIISVKITEGNLPLLEKLKSIQYLTAFIPLSHVRDIVQNMSNMIGLRLQIATIDTTFGGKTKLAIPLDSLLVQLGELKSLRYFSLDGLAVFPIEDHDFAFSIVGFSDKTTVEYLHIYEIKSPIGLPERAWFWCRIVRNNEGKYMGYKRTRNQRVRGYLEIGVGFDEDTIYWWPMRRMKKYVLLLMIIKDHWSGVYCGARQPLEFKDPYGTLSSSSTMSLSTLPLEILEKLIGNIDKPRYLLALALVCKALGNILIPDHLDYRIIQCSPADAAVWEHHCFWDMDKSRFILYYPYLNLSRNLPLCSGLRI
ncbi:hypothetical protein M422DRAFT_262661 [Sphaerobolus stellatus SS14]|uniref:F-box domain-containing protein n=1 Tax=Sphaerobolus stellatus (strain SS14) TaxID=990650 RepID=A0A0C9VC47_SPHS4|nr:hypothetical protein M422DRAFT_262661 [Sphaerobolus stellatus SS14]